MGTTEGGQRWGTDSLTWSSLPPEHPSAREAEPCPTPEAPWARLPEPAGIPSPVHPPGSKYSWPGPRRAQQVPPTDLLAVSTLTLSGSHGDPWQEPFSSRRLKDELHPSPPEPPSEYICHIWHHGGLELALNIKWLLLPGALSQPCLLDMPTKEAAHLGYSHDSSVAYRLGVPPPWMQNEAARIREL